MKNLCLLFFVFCNLFFFGQIEDAWIYFADKPLEEYYLENPLEMLSQRALNRRTNQNIALDFSDVPVHQPYINAISNLGTIQIKAKSKWMNAIHVRATKENIIDLLNLEFVSSVDFADKLLNPIPKSKPKPNLPYQQKSQNITENYTYGFSANQIEVHNGHFLHQEDFTGSGKIIAVLDNGFIGVNSAPAFSRLHSENLILGGYDFVNRNENFYVGGSHGTRVLSIIGAYQENELIGTAPNANFYLFITEDNTSETPLEESLWVEAAEKADSLGVDIINTSLGYSVFDNPRYNYTYNDMDGETTFISRGTNFAYSKGMICVNAAGNSGNGTWQYITAPADAYGAFTIGAIDNNGTYAYFSSIGPTFDGRIKPDVMAQGVATVNALPNGDITTDNGTSFASPVIAGLMACLWEAFPNLTNQELMEYVRESAHLYQNPTAQMGYGIPNFYQVYQDLKVDKPNKNEFSLYPNPTSDFLYFYTNNTEEKHFKVFDVFSKTIIEKSIKNNSQIEIQHLPNGMYFYQISTNNQIKTGKIVKQ